MLRSLFGIIPPKKQFVKKQRQNITLLIALEMLLMIKMQRKSNIAVVATAFSEFEGHLKKRYV